MIWIFVKNVDRFFVKTVQQCQNALYAIRHSVMTATVLTPVTKEKIVTLSCATTVGGSVNSVPQFYAKTAQIAVASADQ